MKSIVLIFACIIFYHSAGAQLKVTVSCPPIVVDLLDGNINKLLYPKSTLGEVKKALPCLSDVVETGTESKCAGVFDAAKGINFYTERNYIEITESYKGKLNPALMGQNRSSLFNLLGYPKIKDVSWDAFQMEYGTLILYYNKAGKISKIQFSSKSTDALKLCE